MERYIIKKEVDEYYFYDNTLSKSLTFNEIVKKLNEIDSNSKCNNCKMLNELQIENKTLITKIQEE